MKKATPPAQQRRPAPLNAMTFAADIRHWRTLEDYAAHLAGHDKSVASWARGLTLHHTISPTIEAWAGRRSVENLRDYYATKPTWRDGQGRLRRGWSAGPHLFIAKGARNPQHDGVWQLTPISRPGVHAVSFNATHLAIEVVGRFDAAPWPAELEQLVTGAAAVTLDWLDLEASTINGHRDDPKTRKSCPGSAINLEAVRQRVAQLLDARASGYTAHSPLIGRPLASLEQAIAYFLARPRGAYTAWDVAQVIIPAYWAAALALGLDPVLVLAQLAHEAAGLSSWWAARPRRNPAGLAVTGRTIAAPLEQRPGAEWTWDGRIWRQGLSFGEWVNESIPAHIGRLLAYALEPGTETAEQLAAIDYALGLRPLARALRGSAPQLEQLGAAHNRTGDGWADPGDFYGRSIAKIANQIAAVKL